MKARILLLIGILTLPLSQLWATHQRAGEITYRHISGLTYEFTLVTYTYTPSPADRPELEVFWGDSTSSILSRTQKINFPNDISQNIYIGTHTFPGPGSYNVSMEDPNRNYGVLNIPNSVNVPFYLETTIVINPFLGPNNSVELLNPPIDNGCINQLFIHNPGAFDVDGDSLSYRLVVCKGEDGLNIPGYTLPAHSSSFSIDEFTGDLIWDTPIYIGEYNVAFVIEEWRNGILIGSVRRDMQINIVDCNNNPPEIDPLPDTCVEAGTFLSFMVTANDPNGDNVTLSATGGPLNLSFSPADFTQPVTGPGTISSIFNWQTDCAHVRKSPYQMTFRAEDNGIPVSLIDVESILITIVAPAPENLNANPAGNKINLKWEQETCSNAIGYDIYRRNGSYGFVPDHCETGVPAYTGYSYIGSTSAIDDTTYIDDDNGVGLIHGLDYCYMVVASFSDGAESYASNEACATLVKDVPVITNVSIRNTDVSNGSVYVAWSKPTELDTVQIPGPYKYLINRSQDLAGTNFALIDSLPSINDTTYIDSIMDTENFPYSYRIDFINDEAGNRFLVGSTQIASSIYLNITSGDNALLLDWTPNIPWTNDTFVVFRYNSSTSFFDSIGYSLQNQYVDSNLNNGTAYCYYVKSIGAYSAPGFVSPIINFSQENCGVPEDMDPPCPPELIILPDCDRIENNLIWTNPNSTCANDVVQYMIYYSPQESGDLNIILTVNNPDDTTWIHENLISIAGCYAVVAVDSFGNQSQSSAIVCIDIDSCSLYRLPNVFTPNGDGFNDYYEPFPYSFVESIDIQIFNRWGVLVYETTNPDILWDGRNKDSGKESADGVYYYVCDVYELRLRGVVKRTITGFFHLIR